VSHPSRKRLKVILGDFGTLFDAWCYRNGLSATEALQGCLASALDGVWDREIAQQSTSAAAANIWIDASDLYEPFAAWCSKLELSTSAALRILVIQLLLDEIHKGSAQSALDFGTHLPAQEAQHPPAALRTGKPDNQRQRKELRLSASELAVLTKLADQRHVTPQRLILQVLRAFLLKAPSFSAEEITQLGASNLALLRIGNNLNQIARKLNVGSAMDAQECGPEHTDQADLTGGVQATCQAIQSCVGAIHTHVDAASALLSAARERWQIELPA